MFEVLLEGGRGGGKSDALLMDYLQHVGQGYGQAWRGILFRRTFPELDDIIAKSRKWFPLIFPNARYNEGKFTWTFEGGEQFLFRHIKHPREFASYKGHEYPWIGFEELTEWNDLVCYNLMKSCSRSSRVGMPKKVRATTNPYGVGHTQVKRYFQLPQMRGRVISELVEGEYLQRVAIRFQLAQNRALLDADPMYRSKISKAARNESERKAWLNDNWDVVSGGMFDDLWNTELHVVDPFPMEIIPPSWFIDRALDWGSAKPFAVGWFAQSSGEIVRWQGRTYGSVPGDIYVIGEWYGCTSENLNEGVKLSAPQIAQGIVDREDDWGLAGRVRRGPADHNIFQEDPGRTTYAHDMEARGVSWDKADKGPGSRKQGWGKVREYLGNALPPPGGGPREDPGLFVFSTCTKFIDTVPSLPRSDKDLDDVDTDAPDHWGDCLSYRLRRKFLGVSQSSF